MTIARQHDEDCHSYEHYPLVHKYNSATKTIQIQIPQNGIPDGVYELSLDITENNRKAVDFEIEASIGTFRKHNLGCHCVCGAVTSDNNYPGHEKYGWFMCEKCNVVRFVVLN